MAEDWFLEAIDAVERAGREACDRLALVLEDVARMRAARASGTLLSDVVSDAIDRGGREARRGASQAFTEYEQAVAVMRGAVVRGLVDDEGLTLSDAGARLGVSRQAAGRLYQSATEIT
jgi:hypothetical protein